MRLPKNTGVQIKILKALLPLFLFFSLVSFRCKMSNHFESADPSLKLIASYDIKISEPSGITFNNDYTAFWIVDGGDQVVYKTDLEGRILEKLNYEGNDLEGICFDRRDSSLWLAEERKRELVQLDLKGNVLRRVATDITGKKNKGIEGLTHDGKDFYVVNEQEPVSIMQLDNLFKVSHEYNVDFAKDLSDVDYDKQSGCFFLLSDESKAIYIWNPKSGMTKEYALPFSKGEGIAVNSSLKTIYIVNDELNTLYVFQYK